MSRHVATLTALRSDVLYFMEPCSNTLLRFHHHLWTEGARNSAYVSTSTTHSGEEWLSDSVTAMWLPDVVSSWQRNATSAQLHTISCGALTASASHDETRQQTCQHLSHITATATRFCEVIVKRRHGCTSSLVFELHLFSSTRKSWGTPAREGHDIV